MPPVLLLLLVEEKVADGEHVVVVVVEGWIGFSPGIEADNVIVKALVGEKDGGFGDCKLKVDDSGLGSMSVGKTVDAGDVVAVGSTSVVALVEDCVSS